ncbi:MAG: hypothetical protein IJD64_03695 [Clostridia bacterium]|nr:hypothetical protein [Clostridia bacterium]
MDRNIHIETKQTERRKERGVGKKIVRIFSEDDLLSRDAVLLFARLVAEAAAGFLS